MDSKTLLSVWALCLCVAVAAALTLLLLLDVHDRGALEQEAAPLQGDSVVRAVVVRALARAPETEPAPAPVSAAAPVQPATAPLPGQPPEERGPQGQP